MRVITFVSILLAAGCASGGKIEPPAERVVQIDATNIVPAQKAGYKIVNKDGKALYCKRSLNTGSHLRYSTSCLTEQEWRELAETSERGVEEMRRNVPPPQGK